MSSVRIVHIFCGAVFLSASVATAQDDTLRLPAPASLPECLRYALTHQPSVRQADLDERIADRTIAIGLSGWLPQVSLSGALTHNTELSAPPASVSRLGPVNTSSIQLSLSQTIFDRDVLAALSTRSDVRERAHEQSALTSIDVVVNVSKAYYAVLTTSTQLAVLRDDITRLRRNLEDARSQFRSGVVDKTDYQRATITLNNVEAEAYQAQQQRDARLAALKEAMGYPSSLALELPESDSAQWSESGLMVDTTQHVVYENRVEYRQMETERRLRRSALFYAKWSFLPALSAVGAYSYNYQADALPPLFDRAYANSFVGLRLSLPIFEGGRRLFEISRARLELERADYDIERLKLSIDAEFAQASANYKSNLRSYLMLKENAELARDVYETLQLQYRSGIKTYLDVLTAENDLRAAEANRTNAFYQLISGKLDMERALGRIRTDVP